MIQNCDNSKFLGYALSIRTEWSQSGEGPVAEHVKKILSTKMIAIKSAVRKNSS